MMDAVATQMIPATPQQEGIWFHALTNGSAQWNFANLRSFGGTVHPAALATALRSVIERHSSLRTNFRLHDNTLYQVISETPATGDAFICIRYEETTPAEKDRIIRSEILSVQRRDPDLEKDALISLKVLQFGTENFFLLTINHIVTDQISMQILWSELSQLYNSIVENNTEIVLSPVRQYADFAIEQQEFLSTGRYGCQKQYWLDKLSGEMPVLDLPFYKDRDHTTMCSSELLLSEQLTADIRNLTLRKRILYSSVFLAAYFLAVYKYTRKKTIMIGNIINGRTSIGKHKNDPVAGVFANMLVHLQDIDEEQPLFTFLGNINEDLIQSFRNADAPYDHWVREYAGKNRYPTAPLVQAAFNVIKSMELSTGFSGMEEQSVKEYEPLLDQENQFDINLFVLQKKEKVRLYLELRSSDAWISMPRPFLESIHHILGQLVYAPERTIGNLSFLAPDEAAALRAFNNTGRPLPQPLTIHGLFKTCVHRWPERIALVCAQEQLTYRQLDRLSDRLAAYLQDKGVGSTSVVPILLKRSPWMVISMLAVLKAGAAYLPLDPEYPAKRIAFMLEEVKAPLLIGAKLLRPSLPDHCNLVFVEDLPAEIAVGVNEITPAPQPAGGRPHEDALAYLIYTSGSTGEPKGVMIKHSSVINFIRSITGMIQFENKRVYSLTTIGFDIFVLESLLALCAGSTVILASEEEQKNPAPAAAAMLAHKAHILQATPSRMKMLLEEGDGFLNGLTDILVGGEPFPPDLLEVLRSAFSGNIYNMYGPTETTVWSSAKNLTGTGPVTAGRPLDNTRIFILGEDRRTQGIGVPGEIGIAGEGLSSGYWNKPRLTAERFIFSPDVPGERIYLTGDIGRWTPAGELEIMGRNDSQVKIRGYRVELDDIACHLKTHPDLKDAAVICVKKNGYDDLYAFYVSKFPLEARLLRTHLRNALPEFMIPSYFIHLNALPLTPNNKVDREALRNIDVRPERKSIVDYGDINGQLLSLWVNILQVDNDLFSEHSLDNFFESGGHSLKALHMLEIVEKEFNVKIPVRDFFKHPTLQFLNNKLTLKN